MKTFLSLLIDCWACGTIFTIINGKGKCPNCGQKTDIT